MAHNWGVNQQTGNFSLSERQEGREGKRGDGRGERKKEKGKKNSGSKVKFSEEVYPLGERVKPQFTKCHVSSLEAWHH